MDVQILWSLRLGFSSKQAIVIKNVGLENFLQRSFQAKTREQIPVFLEKSPKNFADFKTIRLHFKEDNPEARKQLRITEAKVSQEMKSWWIETIMTEEFPLREKMTCFWHNHFVSTYQKVKVNYYINIIKSFKKMLLVIIKS